MIRMGIDASTSSTGWSIFDCNKLIAYGLIKPKGNNWQERVIDEWGKFCNVIDIYHPVEIIAEDVPLKDGKPTILKLGAVQGMILSLAAKYKIKVHYLLPSDWRKELDLYDGTREGTYREVLKKKAINIANKLFNIDLMWVKPKSKLNQDDIAEAILICYSQVKPKKLGK